MGVEGQGPKNQQKIRSLFGKINIGLISKNLQLEFKGNAKDYEREKLFKDVLHAKQVPTVKVLLEIISI